MIFSDFGHKKVRLLPKWAAKYRYLFVSFLKKVLEFDLISGCSVFVLQLPAYFYRTLHARSGMGEHPPNFRFSLHLVNLTGNGITVHELPKGAWRLALLLGFYASCHRFRPL